MAEDKVTLERKFKSIESYAESLGLSIVFVAVQTLDENENIDGYTRIAPFHLSEIKRGCHQCTINCLHQLASINTQIGESSPITNKPESKN